MTTGRINQVTRTRRRTPTTGDSARDASRHTDLRTFPAGEAEDRTRKHRTRRLHHRFLPTPHTTSPLGRWPRDAFPATPPADRGGSILEPRYTRHHVTRAACARQACYPPRLHSQPDTVGRRHARGATTTVPASPPREMPPSHIRQTLHWPGLRHRAIRLRATQLPTSTKRHTNRLRWPGTVRSRHWAAGNPTANVDENNRTSYRKRLRRPGLCNHAPFGCGQPRRQNVGKTSHLLRRTSSFPHDYA